MIIVIEAEKSNPPFVIDCTDDEFVIEWTKRFAPNARHQFLDTLHELALESGLIIEDVSFDPDRSMTSTIEQCLDALD